MYLVGKHRGFVRRARSGVHEGRQARSAGVPVRGRRPRVAGALGFDPAGKRIVRRGSGRTKTEARAKLKEVLRDHDDGLAIAPSDYTVTQAVRDWLAYRLNGRSESTVTTARILARTHVIPDLDSRRLRDPSAEDVDRWLARKAKTLSTRTLQGMHSCLNRAVKRAMARDKVKRNVVALCSVPQSQAGRPSKALTLAQAEAVLTAAQGARCTPTSCSRC